MLRGVVELAEDAAPSGLGAVAGLTFFGGPLGAGVGAMLGVAVSQAIDGAERRSAQDDAVNDLIRNGNASVAALSWWERFLAGARELVLWIILGWLIQSFAPPIQKWPGLVKGLVLKRKAKKRVKSWPNV